MEPITNRVEQSDILVFNLEEFWDERPIVELDIEPFLFEGMVLREKDFRQKVRDHDWQQYEEAHVAVFCSADAIVPTWAYMLIATKLDGVARSVTTGRKEDLLREHFARTLERADLSEYRGKPVVIKGCGSKLVPPSAYVLATEKLQGVASKLMYGEPCSSVPLWRRKSESTTPADTKKPDVKKPGVKKPDIKKPGVKKPAVPAALQRDT